jgi:putative ABC transport system permease protein
MKLLDIITTASSNMFRSKVRTSLTILAIFIGSFTLTLTTGLGSGISHYLDEQVDAFGAKDAMLVQPKADDDNGLPKDTPKKYDPNKQTTAIESEGNRKVTVLTPADIEKIRKIDGIKSAEPYQSANVDFVSGKNGDKYLASVSPFLSGSNFGMEAGQFPDNNSPQHQVILPMSYLSALGWNNAAEAVGQPVRFAVTNGLGKTTEVAATISGVERKSLVAGNSLYPNKALMNQLLKVQNVGKPATATNTTLAAVVRFDASATPEQTKQLQERLKAAGYNGQTVEDQIGQLKTIIKGIIAVLNGFALIALLAASFGIINTLLMSIQERTKEIGLMKAMGMTARRIFLLFSFEAMMLGFWGSLLGSLAAIGIGTILNQFVDKTFLKDLVGLKLLAFSPLSLLAVIGLVMAIAFVAGTVPAIRASRQNPIDSLRYE